MKRRTSARSLAARSDVTIDGHVMHERIGGPLMHYMYTRRKMKHGVDMGYRMLPVWPKGQVTNCGAFIPWAGGCMTECCTHVPSIFLEQGIGARPTNPLVPVTRAILLDTPIAGYPDRLDGCAWVA